MNEKRIYKLCLTVMLAFSVYVFVMTPSQAVGEGDVKVKGKVISINDACDEMVFAPENSTETIIIKIKDEEDKKRIKPGSVVLLTYRPGKDNIAVRIGKTYAATIPVGCGGP